MRKLAYIFSGIAIILAILTLLKTNLLASDGRKMQEMLTELRQKEEEVGKLEEEIARAAGERASFNLIHLDTAFKIDIFTLKPDAYSKQAFARRVKQPLSQGGGAGIWLQAPEDVIISKLQWYKLGGETSAKQPSDITGVLKTQGGALDTAYLSLWLERLALTDLFQKIQSAA